MNKFHQEIFGRTRRLPELADRKSKGQGGEQETRDYGIEKLSGLKQREQLLKQLQKGLFPTFLSGLPKIWSIYYNLGRYSCPITVWSKHCLGMLTNTGK